MLFGHALNQSGISHWALARNGVRGFSQSVVNSRILGKYSWSFVRHGLWHKACPLKIAPMTPKVHWYSAPGANVHSRPLHDVTKSAFAFAACALLIVCVVSPHQKLQNRVIALLVRQTTRVRCTSYRKGIRMNSAHLHLLLNHVPVIGMIFGLFILLFALLRNSDAAKRIALSIFVVAALFAIPTYLSGEPAEEVAEHLPGVTHTLIESHEEAAQLALVAVEITGLLSLVGLILARRTQTLPQWLVIAPLALALVTTGLLGWTANLGGQIRHTEIRRDFTPSTSSDKTEADAKPKTEEKENHE
ncbi:MAG TPA: hypothetical protein VFZ34_15870 [Blastocatellia bacterium]|nr:hypothetical protein [Blastocatellia bacterium]